MALSLDLSLHGRHHAFGGQSPPIIILTSGSGYAGSVLQSSAAGQWTADGVAISGATGNTYTITVDTEGKDIRCGNSNVFAARWLPSQLSGLVAWFDANYDIGLNGSNVASWASRVGSIVAVQSTAANQPVYDGVNKSIAFSNLKFLSFTGITSSPINRFSSTILKINGFSGNMSVIGTGFGGLTDIITSAAKYAIAKGGVANILQGTPTLSTAIMYQLAFSIDINSLNAKIYNNFIKTGDIGISNPNLTSNSPSYISSYTGSTDFFNGNIKEKLIYDATLTDVSIKIVEGYQAHKWGLTANLPSDHPYKSTPPLRGY